MTDVEIGISMQSSSRLLSETIVKVVHSFVTDRELNVAFSM